MAELYAGLIRRGAIVGGEPMTIDRVPLRWRAEVEALLESTRPMNDDDSG